MYGFVIKAMIICSSKMGILDFGPMLAYTDLLILISSLLLI